MSPLETPERTDAVRALRAVVVGTALLILAVSVGSIAAAVAGVMELAR